MTLSILLARALIDGVGATGVPRERFLAAAGFDPARLDAAEARITAEEYDTLVETALDVTGDEAFGLHFGERTSPQAHQLVAHLVTSAGTLRDGLEGLLRFQSLLSDQPACRLEESEGDARLVYDIAPGPPRCRRFRTELAMTGFARIVQFFAPGARPRLVAFEYRAPAYGAEYHRIFRGAERFAAPFTGLLLDRDLLSTVPLHHDVEFHRALEVQAETRMARLGRTRTWAERVRDRLLDGAAASAGDMDAVARALGVGVRTLRRRLQEEGATFSAIVGDAFVARAKRLLVDEARSVEETAYVMGYSTPTAFHKAFKRSTGTTPKEFRQRHGRQRE